MSAINLRSADAPVPVAIVAMAETTASVIYGMYDMFKSAGRDWSLITDGVPGRSLIEPLVVSADGAPLLVGNEVQVCPDLSFAACPPVALVCVPELAVPPGEPIEGRFDDIVHWLQRCHGRHSSWGRRRRFHGGR
jgi:transcriptional regulator GlxA family with amidase domain